MDCVHSAYILAVRTLVECCVQGIRTHRIAVIWLTRHC